MSSATTLPLRFTTYILTNTNTYVANTTTKKGTQFQTQIPIDIHRFIGLQLRMTMRMRKYAVHAEYAHIREYAVEDENLLHIYIHI